MVVKVQSHFSSHDEQEQIDLVKQVRYKLTIFKFYIM